MSDESIKTKMENVLKKVEMIVEMMNNNFCPTSSSMEDQIKESVANIEEWINAFMNILSACIVSASKEEKIDINPILDEILEKMRKFILSMAEDSKNLPLFSSENRKIKN